MWLSRGNLFVKVTRASDEEVEWLRSKESGLTYGNKKTIFTKGEVELTRFYDLIDSQFPSGFLPMVLKRAKEHGVKAEVIDARVRPVEPVAADLSWLRDYQDRLVRAGLDAGHGIVDAATGAGKTEVAIAWVKSVPCRWLFLVHRKTLMEQAAQRYELRCPGMTAGRVGEGLWKPGDDFTVATFQTLATAMRGDASERAKVALFLASFGGLIVDEAHVLPAESFWEVAMAMPNAYWRFGISGTPLDREDQRSVYAVAALGPVIAKVSGKELVERGVLARPNIRMVRVVQDFDERDEIGLPKKWPWAKVYREGIVKSKLRNRTLLAAAQQAEKPSLAFVKDIAHGKAFAKALQKRGIKADFVYGNASLATRQRAVQLLVRGDYEVLVSSVIFQEGVDIPELRSVVVASGGKSVIAALQRLGRGMRRSDGKDSFEVWDVEDDGNAWLKRHSRRRRRAYTREGYKVAIIQLAQSFGAEEVARGEQRKLL